jgi:O-antigen/teichoic acid export membrane protein
MKSNNRIIVNTIILYAKILINVVISLWTVPIVLRTLGQSDYGLYSLVAGVIAMLAFLNSSMTVVTQRYMSVTIGKNNLQQLNEVYNASIRIHIVLGVVIFVLLEVLTPFLFNGFLNIESERLEAATILYQFMIVSTLFTILSVPFDATLNAYENMLVFALIAIVESVLKLCLALSLSFAWFDKLVFYGLGIASISILGVIVRFVYVNKEYQAIHIRFKEKIPRPLYHEMLSYAGWNTFGSVAMIGKNQGIAVVLNLFKGTAINASYGIANHINGILSSFTASIQKAISPRLMQQEGASNRGTMIEMSFSLIKMATIIFSFMAIPLILEMDQILSLWIHDDIPPYAVLFCQLVIIMQLVYQFSSGIALAIDAVGKIKQYRIVLSSVLLLNIPFAYIMLRIGLPPYSVLITMIIVEMLCFFVRLYYANKLATFPVKDYFDKCFYPVIITIIISFIVGLIIMFLLKPSLFRVLLVILFTFISTSIGGYFGVLSHKERTVIRSFGNNICIKFGAHK